MYIKQLLTLWAISKTIISLGETVIDNTIRDKIDEPAVGSVVYCDLAFGLAEHSGIYLGNGKIMHLNGKGWIEEVTADEFIQGTTAISIYVSCIGSHTVGHESTCQRAIHFEKEISVRNYNFIFDNCHQFTASCITGDTENSDSALWMLKDLCEKEMSIDNWRVWER